MPVDSRIPLGITYPQSDLAGNFQKGFNLKQDIEAAPFKQKAIEAKAQDEQLTAANNKLTAVGNLLANVKDQQSYSMAKQQLAAAGIINPADIPDQYDPAYVDMHKNSLLNAKAQLDKQFKMAEIDQMRAGGATGTLLNRMNAGTTDAQALKDTYFGKVNAGKGLEKDPATGKVINTPGYNEAAGNTENVKQREQEKGKRLGEEEGNLNVNVAMLPQLEKTVASLKEIGKDATYTLGGQLVDIGSRQLGLGETKGAVAREKYMTTVRDQVLPMLRQTFGAAFTKAEGDGLLETMGDPDKGPEAKNAALDALINQKKNDILTGKIATGKATNEDLYNTDKPTESEKAAGKLPPEENIPTGGKINTKMARRVTQQEYTKLPSGAQYLDPMGNVRTKK